MKKSLNEKRDGLNRREWLNKAREIVNFIEQAHKSGFAAHEVEQALFRRVIEMEYCALGMFFVFCGDGDEGEAMTLAEGQRVRRLGELHKREYQSVLGLYELWRVVCGTRAGQKIEHVPLDAKLNLPESKFSCLLQDWDQSLSVERPYAKVNATLAKILGLTQLVNSLERTNRKMSEAVSAFWSAQPVPPAFKSLAIFNPNRYSKYGSHSGS
jgi:hypothetical protein